jgi:2-polyprenyl-3-methyl-5-hydroxy-6-metoxy-1,4-benzoquinol methylase
MSGLSAEQTVQEQGYEFPYHYLPDTDGRRFTHHRSLAWGYEYLSYLDFVQELVAREPFTTLLDVGCGDGRFLSRLSRRHSGARLTGVDMSARAIGFARAFNPELDWRCGAVGDGSLVPERHDVVTLVEVLEHIEPSVVDSFLGDVCGRVAQGGRLILSVPSTNIRVSRKHYQHFDEALLRRVLAGHAEVEELHFTNIRSSPVLQAMRWLLHNKLFVLNHRGLLRAIYRHYTRRLFHVKAHNCRRLVAVCRVR